MTVTLNPAQATSLYLVLGQYAADKIRLEQEEGTRKPVYVDLPKANLTIRTTGKIVWGEIAPA